MKPSIWPQLLQTLGRSTYTPALSHGLAVSCRRSGSCGRWTPRSPTSCVRGGQGHQPRDWNRAGCFQAKQTQEAECEWPQTATEVHVAVTRETELQDAEEAKVPLLTAGPAGCWAHNGRGRKLKSQWKHLPLKYLGVNNVH